MSMEEQIKQEIEAFFDAFRLEEGTGLPELKPVRLPGTDYSIQPENERERLFLLRLIRKYENNYELTELDWVRIYPIIMLELAIFRLQDDTSPEATEQRIQLTEKKMELETKLGLISKEDKTETPAMIIEDLKRRAVEFMLKKGLKKTIACYHCGALNMVYVTLFRELWEQLPDTLLGQPLPFLRRDLSDLGGAFSPELIAWTDYWQEKYGIPEKEILQMRREVLLLGEPALDPKNPFSMLSRYHEKVRKGEV